MGVKKRVVDSVDDCGDLCDGTIGCNSFMWEKLQKKCILFSQKTPDKPDEQKEDYLLCQINANGE